MGEEEEGGRESRCVSSGVGVDGVSSGISHIVASGAMGLSSK